MFDVNTPQAALPENKKAVFLMVVTYLEEAEGNHPIYISVHFFKGLWDGGQRAVCSVYWC